MIENASIILFTQDKEIVSLFSSPVSELQTKVVNKPDFASFIFETQDKDFTLAIYDCKKRFLGLFKMGKGYKKRSRVPFIVLISEIDKTSGGKYFMQYFIGSRIKTSSPINCEGTL